MGRQHKTSIFLFDQKAQGHAESTQRTYRFTLRLFIDYLMGEGVARLEDVTPRLGGRGAAFVGVQTRFLSETWFVSGAR